MQYVCNNGVCVQLMCTAGASTTLVSHLYPPVLLVVSRLAAAQVLVLVEPAVATEIVKQRPLSKPRRNRCAVLEYNAIKCIFPENTPFQFSYDRQYLFP